MSELENEFLVEAQEMLEEAESNFVSLEQGGRFHDHYNQIFRYFHSLKGAAGMFGLEKLQAHMHYLESLFEKYKVEGTIPNQIIDYFLLGIDAAKDILAEKPVRFIKLEEYLNKNRPEKTADENKPQIEKISEIKVKVEQTKAKNKLFHAFVVDDEIDIVDILSDFLEVSDFQVSKFTDAHELLKSLKKVHPDVILSDINMPGMSGLEMSKKVAEIRPHLPIIFVSAYITKDTILEGLANGVSGYIDKPFKESSITQQAINAAKKYAALKLLNKSMDLLLYQFSSMEEFLKAKSGENASELLKTELNLIMSQRKLLYGK